MIDKDLICCNQEMNIVITKPRNSDYQENYYVCLKCKKRILSETISSSYINPEVTISNIMTTYSNKELFGNNYNLKELNSPEKIIEHWELKKPFNKITDIIR